MIKRSINQKDKTILNVYVPKNRVLKYMEQKPDRIKWRNKQMHK